MRNDEAWFHRNSASPDVGEKRQREEDKERRMNLLREEESRLLIVSGMSDPVP